MFSCLQKSGATNLCLVVYEQISAVRSVGIHLLQGEVCPPHQDLYLSPFVSCKDTVLVIRVSWERVLGSKSTDRCFVDLKQRTVKQ